MKKKFKKIKISLINFKYIKATFQNLIIRV